MRPGTTLIEACVDSVASALSAEAGGAGRVELCDNLYDGGTTPSAGMIAATVAAVGIPVYVILRPRGGDFVYGESEVDVMRRDASIARQHGAAGVVIGALTRNSTLDVRTLRILMEAADLPVTVHRAFDLTRDRMAELETLIKLGVERVLTSGGAATAIDGADEIARLVGGSGGRIAVMAGGGVREDHVGELVRRSGAREIHVRGARVVAGAERPAPIRFRKAPLPNESDWEETDSDRIATFARCAREAAGDAG